MKKKKFSAAASINIMYLPAVILFVIFIFIPFVRGIGISFTDWNGYSQNKNFVGLRNYKEFFTDKNMRIVLLNTLLYGGFSTLFQNLLGLAYALLMDTRFKARGLVRTIIYLPVIVSPLIMGYILYYVFQYNNGAFNEVLSWFQIAPVDWLAKWSSAVPIVIIVNTLQFVGPAMIIYLTGLQSISANYKEAAQLDGVSAFQNFRYITIPLLMPSITINVIYNLIGGLKLFDIIMSLTKGGPGYSTSSMSTFMYSVYSGRQDAGYATTVGNMMFIMIATIGIILLTQMRKKEVEL